MPRFLVALLMSGVWLIPSGCLGASGAPLETAKRAASAAAKLRTTEGAVLAVEAHKLTIEVAGGSLVTFVVDRATQFRGVEGLPELDLGDRVTVSSRLAAGDQVAEAVELMNVAGVVGVIDSLDTSQLIVKREPDGALETVMVNPQTRYHGRRLGIQFADLKAGDRVIVVVKPGKPRVATLVDVTAAPAASRKPAPPVRARRPQ